MPDSVFWIVLLVGAVMILPPLLPASVVLERFSRRAQVDFALTEQGRLSAGPRVEAVLAGLVWRPTRAVGCYLASAALSTLLMRHGPFLSQSDVKSAVVALVAAAGVVGPYLVLRQFFSAFTGNQPGAQRPAVTVEDYLSPPRRVITWLAATSGLVIPVGAIALSRTESYDGTSIYWEGLVLLPLVSAGVVLAAELESRRVRDEVTDPALLYVWDALRGRALSMVAAVGVLGTALAWEMAAGGLVGVALVQPFPAAAALQAVATTLGVLLKVTALVLVVTSVGRIRTRLWPGLAPGTKLHWGAPAERTPTS